MIVDAGGNEMVVPDTIATALDRSLKNWDAAKVAGDETGMKEAFARTKVLSVAARQGLSDAQAADLVDKVRQGLPASQAGELAAAHTRLDAGDRSPEAINQLYKASRGAPPAAVVDPQARLEAGDRSLSAIAAAFKPRPARARR